MITFGKLATHRHKSKRFLIFSQLRLVAAVTVLSGLAVSGCALHSPNKIP
jgi:hypothetical protein